MKVTVLVRSNYSLSTNYKRATAICTDAEYYEPTIVIGRKTLERSIDDLIPLCRMNLFSQTNRYVNQKITGSLTYAQNVLLLI